MSEDERFYKGPICMGCNRECRIWEEVETLPGGGGWEMWCYCPACDLETFHPPHDSPPTNSVPHGTFLPALIGLIGLSGF